MAFVTRLTFQSGDREALDAVVDDIKATAQRKGAQFKGPHAHPPEDHRVPLYKTVDGEETFGDWTYTVYERQVDIVGHDAFAREVAGRDLPAGIHVAVEVEQVGGIG